MKKVFTLIISFITFLRLNSFCQKEILDTSFLYSILLVEKQTILKDIDNSIFTGNYFNKLYIVCDDSDTVNFEYDYPFIKMSKVDFYKLKKFSIGNKPSHLYMKYSNSVKDFLIKMPFEIFFDKYFVLMSHNTLRSNFFYTTVSSVSINLNTSNKQFVKGINVSRDLSK